MIFGKLNHRDNNDCCQNFWSEIRHQCAKIARREDSAALKFATCAANQRPALAVLAKLRLCFELVSAAVMILLSLVKCHFAKHSTWKKYSFRIFSKFQECSKTNYKTV